MSRDDEHLLSLDGADAQDFADVICGLTVIGAYSDNAGLDSDTDRLGSLRTRVILENRELAEAFVEADVTTTGVSPAEAELGVAELLDESGADGGEER